MFTSNTCILTQSPVQDFILDLLAAPDPTYSALVPVYPKFFNYPGPVDVVVEANVFCGPFSVANLATTGLHDIDISVGTLDTPLTHP